jgi:hypothetical protein
MTTFDITVQDYASGPVKGLASRAARPGPGLLIAARALGNLLKKHFREKAQTPNQLGGDRTWFWLAVGRGVNAPVQTSNTSAQLSITHPAINQKIHGGVITAKRAKFLTIPVHRLAHGRSASVLAAYLGVKLFAVKGVLAAWDAPIETKGLRGKRRKTAQAINASTGSSVAGARKLTVYYALKRSVKQDPDPTALPPSGELERVAKEAFNRWLAGPQTQP